MDRKEINALVQHGITRLRFSADEWESLEKARHHGTRFSLTYPHKIARIMSRNSIVIIEIGGNQPALRLGLVRSVLVISTFDSRVVFDLIQSIQPSSLEKLPDLSQETLLKISISDFFINDTSPLQVPPELEQHLIESIASLPENIPILQRILVELLKPQQFKNAEAMQQDAVDLALKAFGAVDKATTVTLPGQNTALSTVRLHEDTVIEHDARSIPGWGLIRNHITGRALFEKRGEQLEIITANKRPLEELFGVDLIYLNRTQNALVMLQYKMMEPYGHSRHRTGEEKEWIVRIDQQFQDELARMATFDKDLNPDGSYRLNSSPFFIKLIKRHAAINAASIIISLGHLNQLIAEGHATGPRNGLRISYQKLGGHYLRGNSFVELVRSGYIGTRNATTDHFRQLINATLAEGRSLVTAIHEAMI